VVPAGGYLFLARTPAIRAQLEKSVALQNEHGLPTRMLTPAEACKIVPELDASGVEAASYNGDDGVVFPWPFVWGYAQAAEKRGVEVATWHEVTGFETRGGRIEGVRVRRCGPPGSGDVSAESTIATTRVVNAAGAWSPGIARLLGSSSPTSLTVTRSARPSRSSRGSSRSSPTSPTASTSRSRRAARSWAASATTTSRPGSTRRAATPSSGSTRGRSCGPAP